MGYTHYWTQRRDFGKAAWQEVSTDLAAILAHAEHVQGIALRDGSGEGPTRPEVTGDHVAFNGAGEDAHETFIVYRQRPAKETWQSRRGNDFCKTARKPYDLAVTACLCYLATIAETHSVSSDGNGHDWLAGLELARQALPRYANQLDIPRPILEEDRWCSPWPYMRAKGYQFNYCVDGHAYLIGPGGKSYRFHSHYEAAQWAASHVEKPIYVSNRFSSGTEGGKSIFSATGAFDERRHKALARQQAAAIRYMLDHKATGERATPPPAFMRPGDMPALAEPLAYRMEDLLAMAEG